MSASGKKLRRFGGGAVADRGDEGSEAGGRGGEGRG